MNNNQSGQVDRRSFLKVVAGTGITGSVAGCTSSGGGDSGGGTTSEDTGSSGTTSEDSGGESGMDPVEWRGAFTDGGVLNIYGNQIARAVDEHSDSLSIQVDGYSGSNESLRILGRGRAQLAASNVLVANAAYHDANPIAGLDFTDDRSLDQKFSMTNWLSDLRTVFVTTADSDVETINDLKGEKVAMGNGLFAFLPLLDILIGSENVEPVEQPYEGMATALRQGQVAAAPLFAFLGQVVPPFIQDLTTLDLQIIEYTEEEYEQFRQRDLLQVEPLSLSNIDIDHERDEIQAATANYVTVVSPDTSEEAVYEYTKTIAENTEQINEAHAAFGEFKPANLAGNLAPIIPVHPGAAQYYQENDYWNDDLNVSKS